MYTSEYWSKRVSWNEPPPHFPRLSIHSIIRSKSSRDVTTTDVANNIADKSSQITAIPYPQSSKTRKHAKLRAYVHKLTRPLLGRFRSREQQAAAVQSKPSEEETNLLDTSVVHSRFQLSQSPSLRATSPISPVSPVFDSAVASQLEADRAIRAEQDAAFERALKMDQERIERIREKRRQEQERARELAEQEERERIRKEKEAAYRRAQNDWRRWARRALIPPTQDGKGIKFAVRLPSGRRHVGVLPVDVSLEALHTFVETLLIPGEFVPEDDPEEPPEGYVHSCGFRLVMTHERVVLPNDSQVRIDGMNVIKKGVLLIVEEVAMGELPEGEVEVE